VKGEESPIRVVLAEDHTLVRSGLQALLARLAGVEVVGGVGTGRDAVALAESLRPDLVLMDISMPMLNGIDATAQIAARLPLTRVIILSVHSSEEYVAQALAAGASGYVLKGANIAELEHAIRTVASGKQYLTPSVSRDALDGYLARVSARPTPAARLTPRQREVLQLIAEGRTSKEVGQLLGVSLKTVETHRSQIMRRLDVHDLPGLVRYAIREGLVSLEE
jgi:DNA-binding NarL/FixJ family response regulator